MAQSQPTPTPTPTQSYLPTYTPTPINGGINDDEEKEIVKLKITSTSISASGGDCDDVAQVVFKENAVIATQLLYVKNDQVVVNSSNFCLDSSGNVITTNQFVTSVALSVPTGLSITGSPITSSGTLAISLTAGYSIPTTLSQSNWDLAFNDKINSASVTGTTTKTLTLTQQDGGTITASWSDLNTDAVTSVNGFTGAVTLTTF